MTTDAGGDAALTAWQSKLRDPTLTASIDPSGPSMRPAGEDLDLHMGWDRFERLVLEVVRNTHGVRDEQFRRYGVQGQAQGGIDLAGRMPDRSYIVVQCKEYKAFTAAHLRAAVETFTDGDRPFAAKTFIVVTSASVDATQFTDELARLRQNYSDLTLDLWGSEILNDHLRRYADIVARFWSRETADVFCTGAPLPGVPAPPPDRQEQAERILLGPLNTGEFKPVLRTAEIHEKDDPAEAAKLFGQLAERLEVAGFRGHAVVMRRRQLDAIAATNDGEAAAALGARLTVDAVMRGERDDARQLSDTVSGVTARAAKEGGHSPKLQRHQRLIEALVQDISRTVGRPAALEAALAPVVGVDEPDYFPEVVLYLAEDVYANEPGRLNDLAPLVDRGIARAQDLDEDSDVTLRLRLVRAEYDLAERQDLLTLARRHLITGRQAALISAREGRRCAEEGRVEDASEAWRDAVRGGIHAGLPDDAAEWLNAIRLLNLRFGPFTVNINDEFHLARALQATGSGRFLERAKDPGDAAMAAIVNEKPIEAALWAKRWLVDACVTGAWFDEHDAVQLSGDIYTSNGEPLLAASLYVRADAFKKLEKLAVEIDEPLQVEIDGRDPWWISRSCAIVATAQKDLLDSEAAERTVAVLLDLVRRGRKGELTDSWQHSLYHQAVKSVCALAGRASEEQARTLLHLLEEDVPREKNHYRPSDDAHVEACFEILLAHPPLAGVAAARLVALAAADVQTAQKRLLRPELIAVLRGMDEHESLPVGLHRRLPLADAEALSCRVAAMADDGVYLADSLLASIAPDHSTVQDRARHARDSILKRPGPRSDGFSMGSNLVYWSFLASMLSAEETVPCLDKLMTVAADSREAAINRQEAIQAARNLVVDQSPEVRQATFEAARSFATGDRDGSAWDDMMGDPHPLSAMKFDIGSASLKRDGLVLAQVAATEASEYAWVCDEAIAHLRSSERGDVQSAAAVLTRLPNDATEHVDPALLSVSEQAPVRQCSAILAARDPERHAAVLNRLASDRDPTVRAMVGRVVAKSGVHGHPALKHMVERLQQDSRYSVRKSLEVASSE